MGVSASASKSGYPIKCNQAHKGSFGCFIKHNELMQLEPLKKLWDDVNVIIYTDIETKVNKTKLWNYIQTNRIALKIYYRDIQDQYINEQTVYSTMKSWDLLKHTTYADYEDNACFKMRFDKLPVFIDGVPVQYIAFTLFYECSPLTPNDFDTVKFMKDITPLLSTMHRNGYAHLDIRSDNIVKCNNTYKLIDLSLTYSPYSIQATPIYMLPGSQKKLDIPSFCINFFQEKIILRKIEKKKFKITDPLRKKLTEYIGNCRRYCDTFDKQTMLLKSDDFAVAMTILEMTGNIDNPFIKPLLSEKPYFGTIDSFDESEGGSRGRIRCKKRSRKALREICVKKKN